MKRWGYFGAALVAAGLLLAGQFGGAGETIENKLQTLEWQLPRAKLMKPFAQQRPMTFVSVQQGEDWLTLKDFWNPVTETAVDPQTGEQVTRQAVKLKVPLGLSQGPKIPAENPLTVDRWELGRDLYYDRILSSDTTISCATCHDPKLGFTDQLATSFGVKKQRGGMNAPTVMNAAYNFFQFWNGRSSSLEEQAQGPIANPIEMFVDEKGAHAWNLAVQRVRKKGDYTKRFLAAFGAEPTRDNIAMAIASYERTVLNGNSIVDRADRAMKVRVSDEGGTEFKFTPQDYEGVLKEAFAKKDETALTALGLDSGKDQGKVKAVAAQIHEGRELFFGKARCTLCHVGDNFTDGQFHNLGVGAKDGVLRPESLGRYEALPLGHKNPEAVGAFKTPTLRGLVSTFPYMHVGSEETLEQVIDFYDRGGNPNEYLSPKMRDLEAEKAYLKSQRDGTKYTGPKVHLVGPDQKPIVPFQLKLSAQEKTALVTFLKALEGEVPAIVTDPTAKVPTAAAK